MDVYCHPFTSGGQEIPVQEAKLTELITLVTNYSCGEDSCTEESGGLPLDWSEYREPGTQFIKASTSAESIASQLEKVWNMSKEERERVGQKARQWTIDNFSIEVIGKKLEEIIDEFPPVDFDFDSKCREFNINYQPQPRYSEKKDFLIDIYKNILDEDVDENSQGIKHWLAQMGAGMQPNDVVNHFKEVSKTHKSQSEVPQFEELLGSDDKGKRVAVVIPEGNTAVSYTHLTLPTSIQV